MRMGQNARNASARNARVAPETRTAVERYLDDDDRAVIAYRTDYGDGHEIPPHLHGRHQLLHASAGVVLVDTPQGHWVMPPQRGLWIPAGTVHRVRMLGSVSMKSLYFAPEAVTGMPTGCQALEITPFMRALLQEATALPVVHPLEPRALALMAMIRQEVPRLPHLPLSLPLPDAGPLAARCEAFLRRPDAHDTIDQWAAALGVGRRSFTRLFRRETGMSFVDWRQQACLVAALPRLAQGESVTEVAGDLGYDNPAAFTTMFKRALGVPPRAYLREPG